MAEQLAIIREVGYGCRDIGQPCLFFTVKTENYCSLQILNEQEAGDLIKESGVYDVKELEGKPCIINRDNHLIKFVRLAKI